MGKAASAATGGGPIDTGDTPIDTGGDSFDTGGGGIDTGGGLGFDSSGGGFDAFGNATGGSGDMFGNMFGGFAGPGDLSFSGTGGMGTSLYDQACTTDLGGQSAGNLNAGSAQQQISAPSSGGIGGPSQADYSQAIDQLTQAIQNPGQTQGPQGFGGNLYGNLNTSPNYLSGGGIPGAQSVQTQAIGPGGPTAPTQMAAAAPVPFAGQSQAGSVPGSQAWGGNATALNPAAGTVPPAQQFPDVSPLSSDQVAAAPAAAAAPAPIAASTASSPAAAAAEAAPAAATSQAANQITAQNASTAPATASMAGGGNQIASQIGQGLRQMGFPTQMIRAIGELFNLLSGHENPMQFLQNITQMARGGGMQGQGQGRPGGPGSIGPGQQFTASDGQTYVNLGHGMARNVRTGQVVPISSLRIGSQGGGNAQSSSSPAQPASEDSTGDPTNPAYGAPASMPPGSAAI